jgi:hypothetical protein
MKKFLVLYLAPSAIISEWMQKPEAERKEADMKMRGEWDTWMAAHAGMFVDRGGGAGKTVKVTAAGVENIKNDIMLYSMVEGDSYETVSKAFEGHPHFGIPQASIEIMEVKAMGPSQA